MKAIVVMPTYNERPNIEAAVRAVLANGPEWHALVVDDNSPDGTGKLAEELARRDSRVCVLHRAGKLGLGTAYRDGLTRALELGADYACTMDSDFSHDPKVLPRLREIAEQRGAAHASRYVLGGGVKGWSLTRKINSHMANFLTRIVFGVKLRDCSSGFRCYRRDVLEAMEVATLRARGYAILEELLFRCRQVGITPGEYPIIFVDRTAGQSKISPSESIRALGLLFRLKIGGWKPLQEHGDATRDSMAALPEPNREGEPK